MRLGLIKESETWTSPCSNRILDRLGDFSCGRVRSSGWLWPPFSVLDSSWIDDGDLFSGSPFHFIFRYLTTVAPSICIDCFARGVCSLVSLAGSGAGTRAAVVARSLERFPSLLVPFTFLLLLKIRFTF